MQNTFVIGDIHGCHRALLELLSKISPAKEDRIVFLGDYIDRGPSSREVIEELLKYGKEFPQTIFLQGNHEQALLEFLRGRQEEFYLMIGGLQTLSSYGAVDHNPQSLAGVMPPSHMAFFNQLLPYWEDENYIFVHAGLKPGVHLTRQSPEWLYWKKNDDPTVHPYDFGRKVIYGHVVHPTPLFADDRTGIDTGAVYGGHLTCLILPQEEYISVKSSKFWPI